MPEGMSEQDAAKWKAAVGGREVRHDASVSMPCNLGIVAPDKDLGSRVRWCRAMHTDMRAKRSNSARVNSARKLQQILAQRGW